MATVSAIYDLPSTDAKAENGSLTCADCELRGYCKHSEQLKISHDYTGEVVNRQLPSRPTARRRTSPEGSCLDSRLYPFSCSIALGIMDVHDGSSFSSSAMADDGAAVPPHSILTPHCRYSGDATGVVDISSTSRPAITPTTYAARCCSWRNSFDTPDWLRDIGPWYILSSRTSSRSHKSQARKNREIYDKQEQPEDRDVGEQVHDDEDIDDDSDDDVDGNSDDALYMALRAPVDRHDSGLDMARSKRDTSEST